MKKRFLTILLALFVVYTFAFMVACKPSSEPEEPIEIENESKLELNLSSVELEKLEEVTLFAKIDGVDTTEVEWSTTNQNVATVANGKISAIGEGTTVVIANKGDLEARCLVKVADNGLVIGLSTNIGLGDKLYLIKNDNFKVEYQVTYNNKEISDAEVSMTLAENSFAKLENNVVKANAIGEAGTLIITAKWKGLTTVSYVDVCVIDNASAQLSDKNSFTLWNDVRGGETKKTLSPKFTAENVELNSGEYTIIDWDYDDSVVSVNLTTLEVEAVGKGSTNIVATFKSNSSNVTVDSVLPVTVNLYDDDKSSTITLDTLYLDRENYYLDVSEVYADKSSQQLENTEINLITDVTGVYELNLPVTNGIVKIEDANKLGISGVRKWKIECNKFSYIVTVPTVDIDPATNILGKYNPKDWDYSMEIVREQNDVKAVFRDKTNGTVVDAGYCSFRAGKGSDYKAGKIEIDMQGSKVISNYNIIGYYIYDGGCYQMNLSVANTMLLCPIELYSEDIVAPYSAVAGTFTSADWANTTIVLNEDKSVSIQSGNGNSNGTYTLTPNGPVSGKIAITLETALSGQTVFEGDYSYSKGSAEFSITVNAESTPLKLFVREGSTDIYVKLANCYQPSPLQISLIRVYSTGTVLFDYPFWNDGGIMGTYELDIDDSQFTFTLVKAYNNQSVYECTYYVENDVYYLRLENVAEGKIIYNPRT